VCPGRKRSSCRGIAVRLGVARAPQPKLAPAGAFRCEWRVVLGSNVALWGRPCPSAEAHSGHRGLRSLGACFAHGSWLRSHPTPALGARATPRFQRWAWSCLARPPDSILAQFQLVADEALVPARDPGVTSRRCGTLRKVSFAMRVVRCAFCAWCVHSALENPGIQRSFGRCFRKRGAILAGVLTNGGGGIPLHSGIYPVKRHPMKGSIQWLVRL